SDIPLPDYNPEKAISILKDAGWEDTNNNGTVDKVIEGNRMELSIDLLASPSENSKNICLLVQSSAASGGVKINPVFKELRTIVGEHLVPRNFEMYALAWSQQVGDYDPKQLWHSESDTPSGRNWSGFNVPECDAVIDQLRETIEQNERIPLYHKWQEMVVEAQPYIFLAAPQERIAVNKKFEARVSAKKPGIAENLFEVRRVGNTISEQ
ncbi:MAG: hypothetical protein KJP00_01410, partial [Bacteroidia bacterium]|nr:hypothetical protein [Bacteroidia bacterium]